MQQLKSVCFQIIPKNNDYKCPEVAISVMPLLWFWLQRFGFCHENKQHHFTFFLKSVYIFFCTLSQWSWGFDETSFLLHEMWSNLLVMPWMTKNHGTYYWGSLWKEMINHLRRTENSKIHI